MRATGWLVIVFSLVLAPVAWNAGAPAVQAAPGCRQLDSALPWYGDVRQRLQAAIDANSTCSGTWKRSTKAVALFDWDNTEVKNDIADATLAWMLRHDKVLQPADWHATSRHITEAAAAALRTACGTDTPAGRP
ncbi:haloacid dehalogenase-like hydrolase, partial [Mycobacteroides abscessus]